MQTFNFAVGDRVVGIEAYDGNDEIVGVAGTILAIDSDGRYSVEYDDEVSGHNLESRCADGHGWHTGGHSLAPYKDPENPLAPPMAYDEVMT